MVQDGLNLVPYWGNPRLETRHQKELSEVHYLTGPEPASQRLSGTIPGSPIGTSELTLDSTP